MNTQTESAELVTELHDGVLVVRFMGQAFSDAVDLVRKNRIFSFMEEIERRDDAKVVIYDMDLAQMDKDSYMQFFSKHAASVYTNRFCNMIIQLAELLARSSKFTIHLSHGSLVTAFLSLSMYSDYRMASEETVFCNAYRELNATPLGGLPYFLGGRLGRGKAYELLLLQEEISAAQAMELGLVDRLVPAADRVQQAIDLGKRFAALGANTLSGVKQLVTRSLTGLTEYLEFEKKLFVKHFCV